MQEQAIREGLRVFTAKRYPALLEIGQAAGASQSATGAAGPGGSAGGAAAPGGSAGGAAAPASARVVLADSRGTLSVAAELVFGAERRSIRSTIPTGSIGSLIPTIAGDLAYLWSAMRGFDELPLAAAPGLVAILDIDTLAALTGWTSEELEPLGIAGSPDEPLICFPHHYLTLGPLFRVSTATIRDLMSQSQRQEPLQLSAAGQGLGNEIVLLSERDGKIAWIDPATGAREQFDAPGLGGSKGIRLPGGGIGVTKASDLDAYWRSDGPVARTTIHFAASYVSAADVDAEGNIWAFDFLERRVRICNLEGREIYSIRPQFDPSVMLVPQELAVLADGSFLLGGSGEIWKFESSGVPVWRLTRIPGPAEELLPPSFSMTVDRSGGKLALLDAQSRRVVLFSEERPELSSRDEAEVLAWLGPLFSRASPRDEESLSRASELAHSRGLSLLSLQFADRLARLSPDARAMRILREQDLLMEKAMLSGQLAETLARDLLYEESEKAFLSGLELARGLQALRPAEAEVSELLDTLAARRKQIGDSLSQAPEVAAEGTGLRIKLADSCMIGLVATVGIRNTSASDLSQVRIALTLPSVAEAPSLLSIGSLAAGQQIFVEVPLALSESLNRLALPLVQREIARRIVAQPPASLVTYVIGDEGKASARRLPLRFSADADPADLPWALGCLSDPADALVSGTAAAAQNSTGDRLAALASALDGLGLLRQGPEGTSLLPANRALLSRVTTSSRASLRGLSKDRSAWALVILDLARSLGLSAGVLSWSEEALIVVETDITLSSIVPRLTGMDAVVAVLRSLARSDKLCLPLSGRAIPAGVRTTPLAFAIESGLSLCMQIGTGKASLRWLDPPAGDQMLREPVPLAFPFALPIVEASSNRDKARSEIEEGIRRSH